MAGYLPMIFVLACIFGPALSIMWEFRVCPFIEGIRSRRARRGA